MSTYGVREEQIPPAPLFQRGRCHVFWKKMIEPVHVPVSIGKSSGRAVPPFEKGGQGGFALRLSARYSESENP